MKNIKLFDRRVGFSLGALSILLGTVTPAVVPAFASADNQLTGRAVTMSNASKGSVADGQNVTYTIKFTTAGSGTRTNVSVQFCSNSPLITAGNLCTAPAGMNLNLADAAALGGTPGATVDTTHHGANFFDATSTVATGANSIIVSGVTNPTSTGVFYARIVVWSGSTADSVTGSSTGSDVDTSNPAVVDDGSVALSISNEIGVQAAVLESLTFCVRGDAGNTDHTSGNDSADTAGYLASASSTNAPTANCGAGTTLADPSVKLGQWNGTVQALDTTNVSYNLDWAQLNTNASNGAVVYLKSNLACAGLSRNAGTDSCAGIPSSDAVGTAGEAGTGALTAGTSGFGFSFGAAQAPASSSLVGNINVNGNYSSHYAQLGGSSAAVSGLTGNQTADNGLPQDTTSAYGGFVFNSRGAPVSGANVPFALGAAISNNTPAGLYQAKYSLIAVGTF